MIWRRLGTFPSCFPLILFSWRITDFCHPFWVLSSCSLGGPVAFATSLFASLVAFFFPCGRKVMVCSVSSSTLPLFLEKAGSSLLSRVLSLTRMVESISSSKSEMQMWLCCPVLRHPLVSLTIHSQYYFQPYSVLSLVVFQMETSRPPSSQSATNIEFQTIPSCPSSRLCSYLCAAAR